MGNVAKRRRQREGLKRGGIRERQAEAVSRDRETAERSRVIEAERAKVREAARDRKRLQRARERERKQLQEETLLGSASTSGSGSSQNSDEGVLRTWSCRESRRMSSRISAFILEEIRNIDSVGDKKNVMKSVLERLSSLLPDCYHSPQEARARDAFIDSFRRELGLVKVANSHDLLARKSALLDAAVSTGIQKVTALSKVLGSSRKSLTIAHRRRVPDGDTGVLPKLRLSRQNREGLPADVKATVVAWWSNQTKVSPNKKDVVRHRIGRKEWLPAHPTHYLCESQVSSMTCSVSCTSCVSLAILVYLL